MKPPLRRKFGFFASVLASGAHFLLLALRALAGTAQATPADDELNSSIRGGVLNYRTEKLDDGTDPYGWYGND